MKSLRVMLCAAVLAPGVAVAEPKNEASDAAASPRALECAMSYAKAMRMEETMRGMMDGMMPSLLAGMPDAEGPVEQEQRQVIMDATTEAVVAIADPMMKELAPLMAEAFSEAEVCALSEFYGSELGQSVVGKMPEFTKHSMAISMKYVPIMVEDMMKRVCARIDCDSPESSPTKANRRSS